MLIAAIAVLVGAAVQSATGFGFALIAGPILFAVLDPVTALSTVILLAIALNLLVLFGEGRPRRVRRGDLGPLALAALPGLVAGMIILETLAKPTLQIAVGATVIAAVGVRIWLGSPTPQPAAASGRGPAASVAAGLLAGLLTTTTGTNGPPLVLWLHHAGAEPGEFRDTIAVAFLALNTAGALLIALGPAGDRIELGPIPILAVALLVGQRAGRHAFERFDQRLFAVATLALVAIAGASSLVAGIAA